MSVDDRLREAFTVAESDFEPSGGTLELVRRNARRETLRDRGLTLVAAVVVAGVLALSLLGRDDREATDPVVPPGPSVTYDAEHLTGQWKTRRITSAELTAALDSAGLGQWSDELLESWPKRPWRLLLTIDRGEWRLWAEHGGESDLLDEELVTVTGSAGVSISPKEDPSSQTTYAYAHRVDMGPEQIRWVFLETTEPAVAGVPAEAHQRALYTTAPFFKVR